MGKKKEVIPADLFVKPPRALTLKAKADFTEFVRQFPPSYFIEADTRPIVYLLAAMRRLEEVDSELHRVEFLITENDMGTESVHPLWKVHCDLVKEIATWSAYLRVTPMIREPLMVGAGRTGKRDIKMVYNFSAAAPSTNRKELTLAGN
jgi:phage terminase small subunit